MARAKKDGKRINFYMKTEVSDLLDSYCEDVGQTKTEATERILKMYLERYFSYQKQRDASETAN